MSGVLERIKRRAADRNFNNDVVSILNNLRRYKLEDQPIDVGNSTFDGAILEFVIAMVDEMDVMHDEIVQLRARVQEVEAKGCACADAKPAKESKSKSSGAKQTTIDGSEESHDEVAAKANPKKGGK